jgi:hypothetical protein
MILDVFAYMQNCPIENEEMVLRYCKLVVGGDARRQLNSRQLLLTRGRHIF